MRRSIPLLLILLLGSVLALPLRAEDVRYYAVPKGAGAHDVAPAPDGRVWYTAQRQGALGRLDPKTGETEQVPLGQGSAPHGVIVGPDGAAWVTDSGLNAIVRVDPERLGVEVFPLPDNAANANLNTAAFDNDGRLWFTGQNGFYGRLDPQKRTVEAWAAPGGRGPYGITVTPDGEVWYASLAGSHIAHVDPVSAKAEIIQPPTADQGARRIWSDSQGRLWVSEWNSGQLSRYAPEDGSWKSWKLPGDSPRTYSVYVDEQDRPWVTDFAANAILRFDPESERFQAFPSDQGNANVRQMLGRVGEVWGAESGTDRLVVIRY
ncbi:virginiamycin B lyase family protein [Pseudomonas indica]|uniref:Vgb family protein n=1 Tax=Pseudomonas indica TaxID=137658 RepID=UPI0023F70149|nr:lyase [Pseudomonas indica]MBU3058928.1 lyase [Pseudomonas indica]